MRQFWWDHPALLQVVIVNLKHDANSALRGVLWSTRGSWLVLRNAELLAANGGVTRLDGEVVVPRETVSFLQVPTRTA